MNQDHIQNEKFSYPYKKCFVSRSNRCGISQYTPLGFSVLVGTPPMSGFHIIGNSSSPPLTDICLFWPVTYHCQPHGFKTCLLGRSFHAFIKNDSFPTPTEVEYHIYIQNSDTIAVSLSCIQ